MTRWHAAWGLGMAVLLSMGSACGESASPADGATDGVDGDAAVPTEARWEVAIGGLPGALLSVWSGGAAAELWAVGADVGAGTGPMVVRGTAARGWERVDLRAADPTGGHLWWVFGPPGGAPGNEHVWIVGELGRVLRVDRGETAGATGEVTRVASGTNATLYGIWGASEDVLWAVGGYVYPRTGPPTIVRLGPAGGEVVELPAGLPESGTFFKVWGSAANDVWVVGEKGMVLHFDGVTWTRVATEGEPRLVTVHGQGADDVVAVGGSSAGVIVAGRSFEAVTTGPLSPLNGVFVEPGGAAWAVGMLGQVLRRASAGAAWEAVATGGAGGAMRDWHAAWVDDRGDLWVAGGNLLTRLDQGTLLRFGPARVDLPSGQVAGLEPSVEGTESVEVVEVVEAAEVVEAEEDIEVSDASEEGEAEIVEVSDGDGGTDGEVQDADEDGMEAADAGPDVSDVVETDGDWETDDTVSDGADGDTTALEPFEMGRIDYMSGLFRPFAAGATLDMIHGPQGGVHVEVAVRFPWVTTGIEVITGMELRLSIDGVEEARYILAEYPVPVVAMGVCQSYIMPLIFDVPDSALFAGRIGRVTVAVSPPGQSWERVLEGELVDTL